MECSARLLARRYHPIRSWKDVVGLAVTMTVYIGMMKLLEKRVPFMAEHTRRIISSIVTVIVMIAVLSAFH